MSKYGFCLLRAPQEDSVISFLFVMEFGRHTMSRNALLQERVQKFNIFASQFNEGHTRIYHLILPPYPFLFLFFSQQYIISKRQYQSGYMYSVFSSISSHKNVPFHQTYFRDYCLIQFSFTKGEFTSPTENIQLMNRIQTISARSRIISLTILFLKLYLLYTDLAQD